jgi:hypothetical protein
MELVTFRTFRREDGHRYTFIMAGHRPPRDQHHTASGLQVDIAQPPKRDNSAASCIGAPLPAIKYMGG